MYKLALIILQGTYLIKNVSLQINKLYPISGAVDTNSITTPIDEKTGFGTCTCDKTLNTCDTYCCCDNDCSTAILDYWKSNYNTYCTRSYTD